MVTKEVFYNFIAGENRKSIGRNSSEDNSKVRQGTETLSHMEFGEWRAAEGDWILDLPTIFPDLSSPLSTQERKATLRRTARNSCSSLLSNCPRPGMFYRDYRASLVAERQRICLQCGDVGPILGWDHLLERGMAPTPVFFLEKAHGQRSLVGYSLWDHKEPDATERTWGLYPIFLSLSLPCFLQRGK